MNPNAKQTAGPIAKVRSHEGRRPESERLFDDPYARLFDDDTGAVSGIFAHIPFFEEHVRLRTRYIDDRVRAALASGVRDIVLVAAGFDSRGLRMPEISQSGARVIEIDHAEQLEEKRRRLSAAGISIPSHVVPSPADLTAAGALERALDAASVTAPARALWVCEGLLGYLSKDEMRSLAETLARHSARGASVVANHGVSSWSPDVVAAVFTGAGFRVAESPDFGALYRKYLGAEPPPGAEAFALLDAER